MKKANAWQNSSAWPLRIATNNRFWIKFGKKFLLAATTSSLSYDRVCKQMVPCGGASWVIYSFKSGPIQHWPHYSRQACWHQEFRERIFNKIAELMVCKGTCGIRRVSINRTPMGKTVQNSLLASLCQLIPILRAGP